ncbi:adenosine receptor A1-like isoform X2 [Girardinichthys multiradiatus]|uniref:adenosine receptor A1-like isoform X2 n=1 Tax=Girardinichthys multiradiatus TaxID=208333 RepID=UPI001FAD8FD8|nr:adenosine receptor A1-like isoform X2 [Girardinichthys multiradiatus]
MMAVERTYQKLDRETHIPAVWADCLEDKVKLRVKTTVGEWANILMMPSYHTLATYQPLTSKFRSAYVGVVHDVMLRRLKKAAYKYAQEIERQVDELSAEEEEEEPPLPSAPRSTSKPIGKMSEQHTASSPEADVFLMADWGWITYTVLEVFIAVACCLGNVLVVFAVAVGIQDCLRKPTFCFLVSLAVADFLVGAVAVPLAVLLDGWVSLTSHQCLFLSCVVLVLTEASVLSLLAIAIDRYLRLHMPFRYKVIVTPRRTLLVVSVCWILSCLLGFTPLFGWHNLSVVGYYSNNTPSTSPNSSQCTFLSVISLPFMVYFNFLGCVMAPLLVMMFLYIIIFWSLHKRLMNSCPLARASLLREKRLACSLALVLTLFGCCWIPLHLMNCLLLFQGPQAVMPGMLYTGRYSPVSCQLSSQPCDLRLPHSQDPEGLQSNLEASRIEVQLFHQK